MKTIQSDDAFSVAKFKNNVWVFGLSALLFGMTDRAIAALIHEPLFDIELAQLSTIICFFVGLLYFKPEGSASSGSVPILREYQAEVGVPQQAAHLDKAQARMLELQEQHMISQDYVLPMPYVCQIYHLLNLKHLETVHGFSLNNLKVIQVSDIETTDSGGTIKFQTVLDSPANVLRIWRQPVVEVDLTLHTAYTVELSIPVYGNKRITVIFNALPLNENEHRLFIDIYSNLPWPKPLLQIILHIAACLTLFEDLPYLRKLGERNLNRLVTQSKSSTHETMQLFKRFADLYGAKPERCLPVNV
jgi:hypothetical protein